VKKDRFTREQRRHAKFVIENDNCFLFFESNGIGIGFRDDLENAKCFKYKEALQMVKMLNEVNYSGDIKLLIKSNGKLKAV